MATFGGITVLGIDGQPDGIRMHTAETMRPGVPGQDYDELGYHGIPFQVTVHMVFTSTELRNTGYSACLALCGSKITLVFDNGDTWTNMQVMHDMQKVDRFDGAACTDGKNFYLAFRVTLKQTV